MSEKIRVLLDEETVENGVRTVQGELGDIVLDHVSFQYTGSKKPVIQDLSLQIRKGERIALVGENGAGKTTLVIINGIVSDPTWNYFCRRSGYPGV